MNYLEVGGIYKSDLFQNRSIRIVVIDEIQILYETGYGDSWKSEVLLDSSFDFQVISTGAFLARKPEKLRVVRYSDEQQEVLRPDLPISVGRNQKLSWGDVNNLDEGLQNEFKGELKVSNIYIHPYVYTLSSFIRFLSMFAYINCLHKCRFSLNYRSRNVFLSRDYIDITHIITCYIHA